MNRFFEYTANHPFLVAAAAILAVLGVVIEMRQRTHGTRSVGPADAVRLANGGALFLDVRETKDFDAGHIIDARHVPAASVGERAESFKRYKDKPVVVYCDGGVASAGAARTLRAAGFDKVVTLRGGLQSWRQENLPLLSKAAERQQAGKSGKPGKSS